MGKGGRGKKGEKKEGRENGQGWKGRKQNLQHFFVGGIAVIEMADDVFQQDVDLFVRVVLKQHLNPY